MIIKPFSKFSLNPNSMDMEEQIIFPKADPNKTIQVNKEAVEVNSHVKNNS